MQLHASHNSSCPADVFTTRIAGEIKELDTTGYVLKKWEKRIDKYIKYMIYAGKKVGSLHKVHDICGEGGGLG